MEITPRLGRRDPLGLEDEDQLLMYKSASKALEEDVLPRSRPDAGVAIPESKGISLPSSSAKSKAPSSEPFLYKWPGSEQPKPEQAAAQQTQQKATDGSFAYTWPGSKPVEPEPVAKPAEDTGDFIRGGGTALAQTPALAFGALGFAGAAGEKAFGTGGAMTSLKNYGLREYGSRMKEIGATAKDTDDVTKAWEKAKGGDLGALVDWAQYGVGYLGGSIVETVATSALGSAIGGLTAGPAGAVAGAGAGVVGKQAVQGVAKNLIEGMVAKEAAKLAEKEGAEFATEQMLKQATKTVAKNIGAGTALVGSGIIKSTGGIYGEAEEQAGKEGRELTGGDLARIFGSGVVAGLSEAAVDRLGLSVAAGKINIPGAGRPGRALIGGAAGVGIEGGQELFQTAIERFGAGKDLTGEDAMNEYINAFALGGLGGGTVGAVVGAFRDGKTSPDRVRQILDQAQADMTSDDGRQELFDSMFDDPSLGPILQANGIESGDDPRFQNVITKALATQRMLVDLEAPTPEARAETRKQREADVLAAFGETASTAVGGDTGAIEPVIQRASVTPNLETRTLEGEAQPVILPETAGGQAGTVALSPEDLVARQQGFEPLIGITTDKGPVGNRFPSPQAAETFLFGPKDAKTGQRSGGYAQTNLVGQGLEARIRQGKRSKTEGGGTFYFVETRKKPVEAAPAAAPVVTPSAPVTTATAPVVTPPTPVNEAGFITEPPAQVSAQVEAVRIGTKSIVVTTKNDLKGVSTKGLTRVTVKDPETQVESVLVSKDKTIGAKAQKLIADVGFKPAMGQLLGYVEPTATTTQPADAVVVQQKDAAGNIIQEEIVPAAKAGRVKKIKGTTTTVTTPAVAAAERQVQTQGEPDATQTRQVTEDGQPKREDTGGRLPEVREDRVVTPQEQTGGDQTGGGNQPVEVRAQPQEVKPAIDPVMQARVKERINRADEDGGLDFEDVVKLNKMVDDGDLMGAINSMKKIVESNLGAGAGAKYSLSRAPQPTTTGRDFAYGKLKTVDDLNKNVRGYLAAQGSTDSFTAARVPIGNLAGKIPGLPAMQRIADLFGKKLVYFAVEKGSVDFIDGAVLSGSDTIFINVNSTRPHIRVLGHEMVHALRFSNKEIYTALTKHLSPYLDQGGMNAYRAQLNKEGMKDPALILEEAIGDIVGDRFGESSFWQMMADENPSMFTQLARIVVDFLDSVMNKIRSKQTLDSKNLLTDVAAARQAIVSVLADFEQKQPAAQAQPEAQPVAEPAPVQAEQERPSPMFSRKPEGETFYSAMERGFESVKQTSMPAQQWKSWLNSNKAQLGIKNAEIEWTGINEWLDLQEGKVEKQTVLNWIAGNKVQLNDIILTGSGRYISDDDLRDAYVAASDEFIEDVNLSRQELLAELGYPADMQASGPQHKKLTLPNGKDYFELILTEPSIDPYKSDDDIHFGDLSDGKQIGWIRGNIRKDKDGNSVLFLEEIQSQRAQEGRERGFVEKIEVKRTLYGRWRDAIRSGEVKTEGRKKFLKWFNTQPESEGVSESEAIQKYQFFLRARLPESAFNLDDVPVAPFVGETKSWVSLLMKRAIAYAQSKGIDRVSWTTGDQQNDRYRLSRSIDEIYYDPYEDGKTFQVTALKDGNEVGQGSGQMGLESIRRTYGKDIAKMMVDGVGEQVDDTVKAIRGENLDAGGAGMREFYNTIVPSVAKSIVGKDSVTVMELEDTGQQLGFVIPEKLQEQVANDGFPMFSRKRYEDQFSDVSPDTRERALNKGFYSPPTIKERLDRLRPNFAMRIVQGTFDKFRSVRDISQKAYLMLRMSSGSQDGAVSALLHYGQVFNDDGALNVKKGTQGLLGVLDPVGGEVDRFLLWIAANRAAALSKDERERFFSPEDIKSLRGLNMGTMKNGKSRLAVYAETLKNMNELNRSVLDVARDTGLIDAEGYKRFSADIWYIPFYRQMEDDGSLSAAQTSSGAVGQYLSKKLKGSERPLNDLMENVLMNWTHILSASMKNQAAVEALTSATAMGDIVTKLERQEKGAVKVMEKGKETFYRIDDEFLLTSLSAVAQMPSYGWGMDIMRGFKTTLTRFISLSPTFKINNLIRDSIQSIGLSELSRNPIGNVMQGWRAYKTERAEALAGGGLFAMGNAFDGDQTASVKRLLKTGVNKADILDTPEKVASFFGKIQDKYDEVSDASENANRLALYQQLRAKGASHLEASYAARDLQDFSLQGSWSAIRYAAQVLPYFNARLQGLYKLGRDGLDPTMQVLTGKASDTERQKAAKFATVTGAVVTAAMILYLSQKDDEDWKKREDWDRDAFFWFKIPGTDKAVRIPKPFEMGAIATLVERMTEQMIDSQVEGKVFGKRLLAVLHDTFAINPIPQAIRPLYDIARNKDGFTDRPIESMGMERISVQNRVSPGTSGAAVALGTVNSLFAEFASKATGGAISTQSTQLSPIQYDYLLKGYLVWVGTVIQTASNVAATPFRDGSSSRYERIDDFLVVGNYIKTVPQSQSRYVTSFYENAKDISTATSDVSHFLNSGQLEKANEAFTEKSDKIALAKLYTTGTNMMSTISKQIKMVEDDKTMSGAEKRLEIERLQQVRIQIAKDVEDMRIGNKKKFADGGVVKFDPESEDYDYDTAVSAGLGPDGKGENAGHWGSVTRASAEDRKKYGLPDESYIVLKGRKHETWSKAEEAERERGAEIVKKGDRYYSVPKE